MRQAEAMHDMIPLQQPFPRTSVTAALEPHPRGLGEVSLLRKGPRPFDQLPVRKRAFRAREAILAVHRLLYADRERPRAEAEDRLAVLLVPVQLPSLELQGERVAAGVGDRSLLGQGEDGRPVAELIVDEHALPGAAGREIRDIDRESG